MPINSLTGGRSVVSAGVLSLIAALLLAVPGAASAETRYRLTDLGDLPGGSDRSYAFGINAAGQVVGYSYATTGKRAFLWDSTNGMQDLGVLPHDYGQWSEAYAINAAGQVVGMSGWVGFIWDSTNGMQMLGGSVNDIMFANGINDAGQVVGDGSTGYSNNAILWDSTQDPPIQDLGEVPACTFPPPHPRWPSIAYSINNAGQVVGTACSGSVAFLWDSTNGMRDLNELLVQSDPLASCVWLDVANSINDAGWIAANGYDACSGFRHAYLLTPMSPEDLLLDLIETVIGMNVHAGITNALDSKLQNAVDALDRAKAGDTASATGILYAFNQSVEAQRDKALTDSQADELVNVANAIIELLSQP